MIRQRLKVEVILKLRRLAAMMNFCRSTRLNDARDYNA